MFFFFTSRYSLENLLSTDKQYKLDDSRTTWNDVTQKAKSSDYLLYKWYHKKIILLLFTS